MLGSGCPPPLQPAPDPPPPPSRNWLESGRESAYGLMVRPPPPPRVFISRSADTSNWQREAKSRSKRPRQAGSGVLQGVQDLIAELVAKGYRIVYTDGSSKRLSHRDTRRAGGFGVLATEDEQGPEVRFCGYVPTRHRQTNNGAELWAALEALQGFWVPKLAILTNSQYLQLGATGRAQHWKIKRVDDNIRQAASPRARLGNAAPGNGKARKRSQVGTRPSTCSRAGE